MYDQTPAMNCTKYYTVKSGDTLFNIANTYGTTFEHLQKQNNIADANAITPSHRLCVDVPKDGEGTMENFGLDEKGLKTDVEGVNSTVWISVVTSLGCALALAVFVIVMAVYIRRKRRRSQIPLPDVISSNGHNLANAYQNPLKTKTGQKSDFGPFFQSLEIPIDQLEQTSQTLGKGQFGTVSKGFLYKGKGQNNKEKCVVAIKTFLDNSDCKEDLRQEIFFEEMKIMTKVGRHLNIVNLLGFSTVGKSILIILEFCSNGSLLNYLHEKRSSFINYVDRNDLVTGSESSNVHENDYLNDGIISLLAGGSVMTQSSARTRLSTDDLVRIAHQIARGLEYLAGRSIIHRDLAARNILVCENNIVKISDFGLARERILSDYILQNDQVALPIKWMAPESILERNFSFKSDVWSFGVLLWEIFSLGETPFTSTAGSKFAGKIFEFAHAIAGGLRMKRPLYSPLFMYDVMLRCWDVDKDARPSASDLTQELSVFLTADSVGAYSVLDQPYQAYNSICAAYLNSSSVTEVSIDEHAASDLQTETFLF